MSYIPVPSSVRSGLPVLLPRLSRFALALSRDRDAANELVQAACERALEREAQFEAGTRLDHWVFSIVASVWKNNRRRERVRRGNGQVAAEDVLSTDTAHHIESEILTRQVFAEVDRLPGAHRRAILMIYVDGLSYREAADILDVPLGTLMSRLAAAKTLLSARLRAPSLCPPARSLTDA